MSRLRHVVPKYRRHCGSNEAIVTHNGRDYNLGSHGTKVSHREDDRLIGEWPANDRQPFASSSGGVTLVELCARYFKFAKVFFRRELLRPIPPGKLKQ